MSRGPDMNKLLLFAVAAAVAAVVIVALRGGSPA